MIKTLTEQRNLAASIARAVPAPTDAELHDGWDTWSDNASIDPFSDALEACPDIEAAELSDIVYETLGDIWADARRATHVIEFGHYA